MGEEPRVGRPQEVSRLPIIAIDGPAGAGKSTAARQLARRLGLMYLDTGATFRAVAWKAIQTKVSLDDGPRLAELAETMELRFAGEHSQELFLDGENVTKIIRTQEVTAASSRIAVHPELRSVLVRLWRELGRDGGVVLEGRDIGTSVFPDAELKFFLDARPDVRAQRRYEERSAESGWTLESVTADLSRRDDVDRTREHAPLRRAEDAILVDTSELTPTDTLDRLEAEARRRLPRAL